MKKILQTLIILSSFLFSVNFSQAGVVGFANTGLWLQPGNYSLEGKQVHFFANVVNGEYDVFKGELRFYVNDMAVGETIPFAIKKDESKVFKSHWLAEAGDYIVTAKIENVCQVCMKTGEQIDIILPSAVLSYNKNLFVDSDNDSDGLGNREELDLGTDPEKVDSDNDGYSDFEEKTAKTNPLLSTSFPGPDTDGDRISDLTDSDIDNDGLYNWEEEKLGTDPKKRDSDNDGVADKEDYYPLDPSRWQVDNKTSSSPASTGPTNGGSGQNNEQTGSTNQNSSLNVSADVISNSSNSTKANEAKDLNKNNVTNEKELSQLADEEKSEADNIQGDLASNSSVDDSGEISDRVIDDTVLDSSNELLNLSEQKSGESKKVDLSINKAEITKSEFLEKNKNGISHFFLTLPLIIQILLFVIFFSFVFFIFNLFRWLYLKRKEEDEDTDDQS